MLFKITGSKRVSERSKKFSLQRPIRDGKYDIGKRAAESILQRLPKIMGTAIWIICESTAAPRTGNKYRIAKGLCDREYTMNKFLQKISGFRLSNLLDYDFSILSGSNRRSLIKFLPSHVKMICRGYNHLTAGELIFPGAFDPVGTIKRSCQLPINRPCGIGVIDETNGLQAPFFKGTVVVMDSESRFKGLDGIACSFDFRGILVLE
ncbi:MAG: hypothetical protein A4E74_00582 [Syntrophus sp. PtaB.Bin075]|nr:MAG: hypothetical protein A4E74_00582 [Syntrophus sp. PtaB.Bin075]